MATFLLLLGVYIAGGLCGGWLVYEIKVAESTDADI